jgi:TonB family protein
MKRIASCLWLVIILVLFSSKTVRSNDLVKPVLIERPEPVLSAGLKKTNAKGMVIAKIMVSSKGNVEDVEFIKASKIKELDDFLTKWIKRWKYLPRTEKSELTTGFTVITLKYDLTEGKIDAPSVVNAPIQLSDSLISVASNAPDSNPVKVDVNPKTPLKITSIPLEIQNLSVTQKVIFTLQLDDKGNVEGVQVEPPIENPNLFEWFKTYFSGVSWELSGEAQKTPIKVSIPVDFNTSICKFEFGTIQQLQ